MKCEEHVDKGKTRIRGWHDFTPCKNTAKRIAAYGLGFDFYATEIDEEYFEAQEERFHRECFGEIKTERGTLVQTNLFDK